MKPYLEGVLDTNLEQHDKIAKKSKAILNPKMVDKHNTFHHIEYQPRTTRRRTYAKDRQEYDQKVLIPELELRKGEGNPIIFQSGGLEYRRAMLREILETEEQINQARAIDNRFARGEFQAKYLANF